MRTSRGRSGPAKLVTTGIWHITLAKKHIDESNILTQAFLEEGLVQKSKNIVQGPIKDGMDQSIHKQY
jgi:hypothetical protein